MQKNEVVLNHHKYDLIDNFESFAARCLKKFRITQIDDVEKSQEDVQLYLNARLVAQSKCYPDKDRTTNEECKRVCRNIGLLGVQTIVKSAILCYHIWFMKFSFIFVHDSVEEEWAQIVDSKYDTGDHNRPHSRSFTLFTWYNCHASDDSKCSYLELKRALQYISDERVVEEFLFKGLIHSPKIFELLCQT